MGIVANSNVPNLILQLNLMDRTIVYRGMMKTVPDTYWNDTVRPKLYPLWDTEKDRLVEFTWYDNNTYHVTRRKFVKNFKTGEYEWKDYEMEQSDVDAARTFYEFLRDTFMNIEQLQNEEFQEEMGRMYGEVASETWFTVRLARNFLLQESDFSMLSDSPLSDDMKALYTTYRTKLRDLPAIFADVEDVKTVKFPMSPEAFVNVYKVNNPDAVYLDTEDQWTLPAHFFYTQFKDKMTRYLMVRDITDRMYTQAMIKAMREQPVALGIEGTPWSNQHQNLDSIKSSLDELLAKMEEENGGGE